MRNQNITDAISFIREIVRGAYWDIRYHEHNIKKAYVELEFAKEMIRRGGFDVNADRADGKENIDGDPLPGNVTEFALEFLDEKTHSVQHHEDGIAQGAMSFAFAKTMLMRGKYTEISIEEIKKEVEDEVRKWEAREA